MHAVAKSCCVRLLKVSRGQGTISPAVHHLPLGHCTVTVVTTVACFGALDVTVIVVPRAAPSVEPRAVSSMLSIAESKSVGALMTVPSSAVAVVEIVMVRVSAASERDRRRAQGSPSEMRATSTPYYPVRQREEGGEKKQRGVRMDGHDESGEAMRSSDLLGERLLHSVEIKVSTVEVERHLLLNHLHLANASGRIVNPR